MTATLRRGVIITDSDESCELRIYPDNNGVRIEIEIWNLAKDTEGTDYQRDGVTRIMSWKGRGSVVALRKIGLDFQRIAARVYRETCDDDK